MRIAFRGLGVGPRFITDASRVTVTCNAKGCEKPLIAKFVRKDKHIPLAICGGGGPMWGARGGVEGVWAVTRPQRGGPAHRRRPISPPVPPKKGKNTPGPPPPRRRPAPAGPSFPRRPPP